MICMPNTMHSFESNASNVPAFLVKLWKLVEDSSCNDSIAWSDNGSSFIIRDQTRFSKELLPQYFKHNNMASFIRQLNMYGFRKVINYEKSGLRNENDEMEFQHTFFCKGQGSLLELIKRKIPNNKVTEPAVKANAHDILTDLSSIREKQENMDSMLLKMKQENELLWRELTTMRQKHKAQEQIIQKVIQFLVSIVQRSNQNIGVSRSMPRMLHDISRNKKNKVSRSIDVLRSKSPNFVTVPQDKLVSPLGPVIHEVTDFDHEIEERTLASTVESPADTTETTVPEIDSQESECPLNSSLNSPINTSVTMEPLSILEPLQPRTPALNSDESILGIPLEYISASPSDVITIPIDTSDDVIALPDTGTNTSISYTLSSPDMKIYCPLKSEFEDNLLSESLNTPKIPTIHIEDVYSTQTKAVKEKNKNVEEEKNKTSTDTVKNEHSYQLAIADTSNSLTPSQSVTKNTLSNHVLNVEEDLQWLQDQITSNAWNNDEYTKLLGLFSTDVTANNETLAGEIAAENNIKSEVNDIVGNELVQFTPSMLECELDISCENPLLECLKQDAKVPTGVDEQNLEDQKCYYGEVLNEANQETASEAAEYFLSNGSSVKTKIPRHPKIQKLQKAKRRKLK